jgi:hypothetical protein
MSHKQAKRERRENGRAAGHRQRGTGTSNPTADRWRLPLQSAVPLRVLALYERGGITRRGIILAYLAGETLGTSADCYLNGATSAEEGATLFNQTARTLAVLSYLPGGVPEGWGPFDAQALLAGFFGEETARQHVEQARRRAFEIPPNQEPLRELFRRICKPEGVVRATAPPIAYLTETSEAPDGDALARALTAYLAVERFLPGWRRAGQQDNSGEQDDFHRLCALAPAALESREPGGLGRALSEQASLQDRYQFCLQQLAGTGARDPGRIGALFAFARSQEAMQRAIFQHLAMLIACEQLFVLEDELPKSQNYRDVIEILNSLLTMDVRP